MLQFGSVFEKINRAVVFYKQYGACSTIRKIVNKISCNCETKIAGYKADHFYIPELTPLIPRQTQFSERRINLLLPSIQTKHVYGGIATALAIFERLSTKFPYARIIVTTAPTEEYDHNRFAEYNIDPTNSVKHSKEIISMFDRREKTLDVGSGDVFIATAWWTAYILQPVLLWQKQQYNLDKPYFFYLIQDYEPSFYAWSTRFALAESTYYSTFDTIAIFNTKFLKTYFQSKGYLFKYWTSFEPAMNARLIEGQDIAITHRRQPPYQLIVYGRYSVDRNCFELIVQALHVWQHTYFNSSAWLLISAGETHGDIDLGGAKLSSVGKLSLEQYRQLLTQSSVGLSLMVSPHPSYPPLEMAAYGLEVVTNSFGPKNLGKLSPNITSIDILTPERIAQALSEACRRVEDRSGQAAQPDRNIFASGSSYDDIIEQIGEYIVENK